MGIDKRTGYYSHREILGYGCKYNIVLSGRGPGKTWDAAWFFLNVKGPVMVLTRIKPDMMHLLDSFLDPYLEGDEDHDAIDGERFKLKGSAEDGYVMYFDENPKFYFRTISQVNAIKQEHFPKDMAWVWIEEFVPIAWKKIGGVVDEGEAIETIVKTIEHDTPENRRKKGLPEVRVIMHANPARWDNPILAYFGCVPFGYGIRRMSDKVVVEILEDRDTGENYVNKGIATNAQWKDMLHFIAPVAKTAVPWISVRVVEHYYLVYRRIDISYVKIIKGHTIDEAQRWGTLDGLREDERCINGTRVYDLLMRDAYKGRMRFVDINTKFQFLQDLRLMK